MDSRAWNRAAHHVRRICVVSGRVAATLSFSSLLVLVLVPLLETIARSAAQPAAQSSRDDASQCCCCCREGTRKGARRSSVSATGFVRVPGSRNAESAAFSISRGDFSLKG